MLSDMVGSRKASVTAGLEGRLVWFFGYRLTSSSPSTPIALLMPFPPSKLRRANSLENLNVSSTSLLTLVCDMASLRMS